jgi:hypothetical protein
MNGGRKWGKGEKEKQKVKWRRRRTANLMGGKRRKYVWLNVTWHTIILLISATYFNLKAKNHSHILI